MGFVKSAAEIRRIQAALAGPRDAPGRRVTR